MDGGDSFFLKKLLSPEQKIFQGIVFSRENVSFVWVFSDSSRDARCLYVDVLLGIAKTFNAEYGKNSGRGRTGKTVGKARRIRLDVSRICRRLSSSGFQVTTSEASDFPDAGLERAAWRKSLQAKTSVECLCERGRKVGKEELDRERRTTTTGTEENFATLAGSTIIHSIGTVIYAEKTTLSGFPGFATWPTIGVERRSSFTFAATDKNRNNDIIMLKIKHLLFRFPVEWLGCRVARYRSFPEVKFSFTRSMSANVHATRTRRFNWISRLAPPGISCSR